MICISLWNSGGMNGGMPLVLQFSPFQESSIHQVQAQEME
jgi:hypothetical protein